jgi:hypothetical protein
MGLLLFKKSFCPAVIFQELPSFVYGFVPGADQWVKYDRQIVSISIPAGGVEIPLTKSGYPDGVRRFIFVKRNSRLPSGETAGLKSVMV